MRLILWQNEFQWAVALMEGWPIRRGIGTAIAQIGILKNFSDWGFKVEHMWYEGPHHSVTIGPFMYYTGKTECKECAKS